LAGPNRFFLDRGYDEWRRRETYLDELEDSMSGERFRVGAPQVIHETIDGETIIINLSTGTYYSARGTAGDVWQLISAAPGANAAELSAALAPLYSSSAEPIEAAVATFLVELHDEGLVEKVNGDAATTVPATTYADEPGTKTFEAPKLETYTDMQDLVLLDPVHQVDDTGWPAAKPDTMPHAASG
jgi:Coenzyme PQQ synthesis protein D (PqqD)